MTTTKKYRVVQVDEAPKAPPISYTENAYICLVNGCGYTYQVTLSGMGPQAMNQLHSVKQNLNHHWMTAHYNRSLTGEPAFGQITHSWTVGGW